jgi:hypothetical protein
MHGPLPAVLVVAIALMLSVCSSQVKCGWRCHWQLRQLRQLVWHDAPGPHATGHSH